MLVDRVSTDTILRLLCRLMTLDETGLYIVLSTPVSRITVLGQAVSMSEIPGCPPRVRIDLQNYSSTHTRTILSLADICRATALRDTHSSDFLEHVGACRTRIHLRHQYSRASCSIHTL